MLHTKMNKLLLLLCLLSNTTFVYGQNSINELTDRFFDMYERDNPRAAMQFAFGTNPYFSNNDDGVINLLNQLSGILEVVDSYTGHEKVAEQAVGSRLVHRTYLVYYDRQPLRFKFEFYKPKSQWVFHNVMFDVNYEEELTNTHTMPQAGK